MSTNTLKKLVERFAPETVKNEIGLIEAAHAKERDARFERQWREKDLLKSLTRLDDDKKAFPELPEPIACLS